MEKIATCYINGSNDLQCRRRKDRFHRIHHVAPMCTLCSFGPRESALLPNGSSICPCVSCIGRPRDIITPVGVTYNVIHTNLYSAQNREIESEALNRAFHALHAMRTVDENVGKKIKTTKLFETRKK